MLKTLVWVSLFFSSSVFADTQLDKILMENKIIDKNYKVLNSKFFDDSLRIANNNIAPMLPVRVDNITTLLTSNLNRFGLYMVYQFDDIETKEEAILFDKQSNLRENYKNYICSLDYTKSEVFRRNALMKVNMSAVNSKNEVIFNYSFPFSEC